MKKIGMFLMAGVMAFAFAANASAGEMGEKASAPKVSGEVVKADGEFVEVKTADGKTQKFHMDKTTKIMGELKAGAVVEIEGAGGHAMSVTAAATERAAAAEEDHEAMGEKPLRN